MKTILMITVLLLLAGSASGGVVDPDHPSGIAAISHYGGDALVALTTQGVQVSIHLTTPITFEYPGPEYNPPVPVASIREWISGRFITHDGGVYSFSNDGWTHVQIQLDLPVSNDSSTFGDVKSTFR